MSFGRLLYTRGELISALQETARRLGRPPISSDLEPAHLRYVKRYFGSLSGARKAAGIPEPPAPPPLWTQQTIVEKVRALAKADLRITLDDLTDAGHTSLAAAIKQHGGIARIRDLAGVPRPPRPPSSGDPWDATRVLAEIRDAHKAGLPLASTKVARSLRSAGQVYFGSWREAIEAAGLDYEQIRLLKAWTAADVLQRLHELHAEFPELSRSELHRDPVSTAARNHCGGIDAALAAAGITGWPVHRQEPVLTRAETLDALRQREARGEPMSAKSLMVADPKLWQAIATYYDGLKNACTAARVGYQPEQKPRDRRNAVELLRARFVAGTSLRECDVRAEDPTTAARVAYAFGTWPKAIAALARSVRHTDPEAAAEILTRYVRPTKPKRAPVTARRLQKWDEEKVLRAIRERHRLGQPLAKVQVPSTLVQAAGRRFGTWSSALAAAGLDPVAIRLHRPEHTEESLIEWLRTRAREHPNWTISEVMEAGGSAISCARRWGSLEAAARAAGIHDWPRRVKRVGMSRDAVLDRFKELANAQVPLNFTHVRDVLGDRRLVKGVRVHFESWDAAIEAAGLPVARAVRAPWTRESILEQLRTWNASGERLTASAVQERDASLYNAIRRSFGTFATAMHVAGLPFTPLRKAGGIIRDRRLRS